MGCITLTPKPFSATQSNSRDEEADETKGGEKERRDETRRAGLGGGHQFSENTDCEKNVTPSEGTSWQREKKSCQTRPGNWTKTPRRAESGIFSGLQTAKVKRWEEFLR